MAYTHFSLLLYCSVLLPELEERHSCVCSKSTCQSIQMVLDSFIGPVPFSPTRFGTACNGNSICVSERKQTLISHYQVPKIYKKTLSGVSFTESGKIWSLCFEMNSKLLLFKLHFGTTHRDHMTWIYKPKCKWQHSLINAITMNIHKPREKKIIHGKGENVFNYLLYVL